MSYIAWLNDHEAAGVPRIGGKGASLARLGAAGFPVPPGFAVTVDAYQAFHSAGRIDAALDALLACSGRPPFAEVRSACAPILERLEGLALPDAVGLALAEAYGRLEDEAGPGATFAVRSSAVSEDSAGASFAGLYESYLNLRGGEAVADGVVRCYRCLWEPRAAHYRTIKGIDHRRESMAVVVMRTVPSAVSGVAFTLNPVTGALDEVVINSSWGLGEAIVSGMVTPDNYVVGKDGAIRARDISEKEVRVVPVAGGTEKQATPPELASAPSLSDEQVAHVAATAISVEREYGSPVDIEFAYDAEGRFFLLQARPVTTR